MMAPHTWIGRYELLGELGCGGMAELYVGRLCGAGRFAKLVAIKRILPHLARDPQFKAMFLEEGRIAAHLSHPNVCQVFELGELDGELFLAMEYLEGASWDELSRGLVPGPAMLRLTAGVIGQACEGLHCAHSLRDVEGRPMPVVHRDVSPQNLFVTVDGVCKIVDFGVSKIATDGPRTRTGVIKGKLPYMAPEQIQGEPIDARTDVFALGVCTWEALTAQRLFERSTDFLIWKAIIEADVPPITMHWRECPAAVDAVVRRALARAPADRYATARDFAEALRAASGVAPCTPAEIAETLRARCGSRIADRQRQIAAAAVAFPNGEPAMPAAVSDEDAAATRDLRRVRGGLPDDPAVAPTRIDEASPRRARSPWLRTIGIAMLAAAVAVAVTIALVRRTPTASSGDDAEATPRSSTTADAAEGSALDLIDPASIHETVEQTREYGEQLRHDIDELRERLQPK